MFQTRAALRRAPTRLSRHGVIAAAAWLLLYLTLLPLALAQPAPSLALGSYSYIVGETLELTASNLEPGAAYRIELTLPPSNGTARTPLVSVIAATEAGTLRFTSPLQYGGTYRVHISGPRLDASLNVQVSGAEAAVGQAPRNGQTTQQPAPGSEPDTAPEPSPEDPPTVTEPAEQPPTDGDVGAPADLPGQQPDQQPGTTMRQPLPAGVTYRLAGDAVVAENAAGAVVWRLDFPVGSGATAGLSRSAERLFVGHGNHLLELAGATGQVLARHRLPAQVTEAVIVGNVVEVTVAYHDGTSRQVQVTDAGPATLLPFDPDPALFSWLRQEASVADPATRVQQDPTNPWLYMAQVQSAPAGATLLAEPLLQTALASSRTFYERAQLAEAFLGLPEPRTDLADAAMEAALTDFVARGYRAELLTDPELQAAYGFPLGRLMSSLGRGDMARAAFWADWLYRSSTPEVPETQAALREYALYLQEAGQRDEATLWRNRANEGRAGFQVGPTLTNAALTVGRTGWYGVAAVVLSIIALHITLLAKYWRPQSLTMQRARAAGKSVSPLFARLTFMRYATFLEKLVVVLLFAAALALAALQGWSTQQDSAPRAWGSGSLASPAALSAVTALDESRPDAQFVRGFAAQSVGERAAAEQAYLQLMDDPAALNNLAILTADDELLARAAELAPDDATVLYNLGRGPNPSRLIGEFGEGQPLLVAPDTARLRSALAGTYLGAWQSAFSNPWAALTGMQGVSLAPWLWTVLVVLFLAWAAISILYLVIPRPRLARNAPRTLLYHLLALLLPGTGLADEFWGVFLMVPWAIFGVDFLLNYIPGGPDPTMALRTDGIALIVIYVLNLVAFVVEFGSYRKRMRALKHDDPQTAREYGMRVPVPELG
ncbi:MAG: hypothetical protein WDA03_00330 [Trueperaceae bacterium]